MTHFFALINKIYTILTQTLNDKLGTFCFIEYFKVPDNFILLISKEKSTVLMIGMEVTFSDSSMSGDGKVQLQFEDIMLKGCAVI